MLRQLIISILLVLPSLAAGNSGEVLLFQEIGSEAKKGNIASVRGLARQFQQKYPKSTKLAETIHIQAEIEPDPESALKGYAAIVARFPRYPKRDEAQYRICELHYFHGRFKDLLSQSKKGLALFPKSPHGADYAFFQAHAEFNLGLYDEAKQTCLNLMEKDHSSAVIARALISLAQIEKKISGFSRWYLQKLKDMALGFRDSERHPSALCLLGEFYEKNRRYDEAFSAFSDVVKRYPLSPEAIASKVKIDELKKHSPRLVNYIPNQNMLDQAESFDIAPDMEDHEPALEEDSYSVSIGPFASLEEARSLKVLFREYSTSTVQLRSGIMIYVGSFRSADAAFSAKIRLAEEFGINGRIVQITGDAEKKYIYEE